MSAYVTSSPSSWVASARAAHVLHLDHLVGQVVGELELDGGSDAGLLDDVGGPAVLHHVAVDIEIAGDEHSLPRHLDLVEDQEGVLFVEPRRERMVCSGAFDGVVIAADGVQTLGRDRDREAQGVGRVCILGQAGEPGYTKFSSANGPRVPRIFEPLTTMPSAVRRTMRGARLGVDAVDIADGLVDDRVDDRVRQRQVLRRDLALEGCERSAGSRVAVLLEQSALGDEAGNGDVDVVRRPSEHADRVARQSIERPVPAAQIVVAQRDDVADVDQFAGLGVLHQTVVGVLVLIVEVVGHAAQRAGEAWLVDDVDTTAVEPDGAVVLQSGDVVVAGACSHRCTVPQDQEPSKCFVGFLTSTNRSSASGLRSIAAIRAGS